MRRIQIYLDEPLDDAVGAEAARRGVSKAAVIREAVADKVAPAVPAPDDPWQAMIGWLDDEPVEDIDAIVYEWGYPPRKKAK
jgi:hypothetical protein